MENESSTRAQISRRHVLRILAVTGTAGAVWTLGRGIGTRPSPITRSRRLMGTTVRLTVLGDDRDQARSAADATLRQMAELESVLSAYRPGSEISQLNTTGTLENASDALLEIVGVARRVSELGDGAFDVTVQPVLDLYRNQPAGLPTADAIERALALVDYRALHSQGRHVSLVRRGMRVTIDGIGKGYIVDRGVDVLREWGFRRVFVEAGGDLMAAGDKAAGSPWRIGIRGPRPGVALQARFETTNRAVATSGDYMQPFTSDCRQHHIIDPRTGYSAPELASSTVVAPDAVHADALATLTMVLGPERSRALLEDLPGCEGYFVSKNLDVTRTSGFSVV